MSRLISDKYREVQRQYLERFEQLRANEEELNRIFIEIYGLQDELTPEVAEKDVTVYRIIDFPDEEQRKMAYVLSMRDEIVSLISYIVGCMLGRYSPYVDGLLFAGGEWDYDAICARIAGGAKTCDFYDETLGLFLPDRDAIVPITDDEYFADDVVARTVEFVKKVYGADTLEDNLRFLASALGNKGDTPRDVLRNYYLNDFYRDHLKTYQKRPIYWQFDSGNYARGRGMEWAAELLQAYRRGDMDSIRQCALKNVAPVELEFKLPRKPEDFEDAFREKEMSDENRRWLCFDIEMQWVESSSAPTANAPCRSDTGVRRIWKFSGWCAF